MNKPDKELKTRIIRTNMLLHQRDAELYDLRHYYTDDSMLSSQINDDICLMQKLLRISYPRFLDIGAGTGLLSLHFSRNNFNVTAVDISENMLKVSLQKIGERKICMVVEEIDDFLNSTPPDWFHVIGFSSVLHHLPDYLSILDKCCKLLPHGGFLYIINEPPMNMKHSIIGRFLDKIDELLDGFYFKIVHDTSDLFPSFIRRIMIFLKKIIGRKNYGINSLIDKIQHRFQKNTGAEFIDDNLAEFHADTGLNLDEIMKLFKSRNMKLITQSLYSRKRISIFRLMEHVFPGSRHIRMIVQKKSD